MASASSGYQALSPRLSRPGSPGQSPVLFLNEAKKLRGTRSVIRRLTSHFLLYSSTDKGNEHLIAPEFCCFPRKSALQSPLTWGRFPTCLRSQRQLGPPRRSPRREKRQRSANPGEGRGRLIVELPVALSARWVQIGCRFQAGGRIQIGCRSPLRMPNGCACLRETDRALVPAACRSGETGPPRRYRPPVL
jgi:hypothetical protein